MLELSYKTNFLGLRVTQKVLQLPLFPFFFSAPNLDELTKVVCNFPYLLRQTSIAQFGHTGKTLLCKYLFQSEISRVKTWHPIRFREKNNDGSKRAYKSEI